MIFTARAHQAAVGHRTLFTNCIFTVQNAFGWGVLFGHGASKLSLLIAILLTTRGKSAQITRGSVRGSHVSPTGFVALSPSAFFRQSDFVVQKAESRSIQCLEIGTGFSYRSAANMFFTNGTSPEGPEPPFMFYRG